MGPDSKKKIEEECEKVLKDNIYTTTHKEPIYEKKEDSFKEFINPLESPEIFKKWLEENINKDWKPVDVPVLENGHPCNMCPNRDKGVCCCSLPDMWMKGNLPTVDDHGLYVTSTSTGPITSQTATSTTTYETGS